LSFVGKHGTHWYVSMSQRGFAPLQSLSFKHWRQRPASMSQSPPSAPHDV
jgi:hypothetical protein